MEGFGGFGRVWESLREFRRVSESFERDWESLGQFGRVSESLGEFARICENLGEFGRVWESKDPTNSTGSHFFDRVPLFYQYLRIRNNS